MVDISIHCDFCGEQFVNYKCYPGEVLNTLGRIKYSLACRKWGFFNHRYYCPKCAEERKCPPIKIIYKG